MRSSYLNKISMSIVKYNQTSKLYDKLVNEYYDEVFATYLNKGIIYKLKTKTPLYSEALKDEIWVCCQLVLNSWLQWIIHQNEVSTKEMLSQISLACNVTYPFSFGLTKKDLADALQAYVNGASTKPIQINSTTILSKSGQGWTVTKS